MTDVPFIFIHIGKDINYFPHYVNYAIKQCRKWNPINPIFFIGSEVFKDYIKEPNVEYVSIESLVESEKHIIFNNTTRLDAAFKGGFWKLTTERFFILEEFCIQKKFNEFFHLENDNMIYFSSHEMINTFRESVNGITSTTHGSDSVIFGLMYCNNFEILSRFTEFYILNNTGENEMLVGKKFYNTYLENTGYLPILPIEDIFSVELTELEKYIYTSNFSKFKGIFDPAGYGQWLGGIDPRNGESRPFIFVNERPENKELKVDKFDYDIEVTENNLCRYTIKNRTNNKVYPIYLLHIHCKELEKFIS